MTAYQNRLPRIIGHRGACGLAPENTSASFWVAAAADVRWVEFDVQLTADGVPVLIHDETLDRTTNGTGPVAALTWAEIQKLDAGSWFSLNHESVGVPSLELALQQLSTFGLGANVEIKPPAGAEAETARATADILTRYWPAHLPPPLVSSFSVEALTVVRDEAPALDRAALFGDAEAADISACIAVARDLGCGAIHLPEHGVTADVAASVHDAGLAMRAFTVNDAARAEALFGLGVDGVFTDYPDRMTAFLD